MSKETDLLEAVIAALEAKTGTLRAVAEEAGLSYDTVLRIKARESDPGYSKVRRLADVLLPQELAERRDQAAIPPL